MRKTLMIGAALALASSLALAQGPGHGQGGGMMGQGPHAGMGPHGGMTGGGLAALNLSDEQRDKVSAIQEVHRKKVDELRRQMLKSRAEAHNQIAAVLTPEQRKQLHQFAPGWMGGQE